MTAPGTSRCVDCQHLDLQSAGGAYARLGMGKCKAQKLDPATFITTGYARQCARFEPAAADAVSKRLIFLREVPA